VSVFHFGADEEDYWKDKDQYNPPGLFETRMKVSVCLREWSEGAKGGRGLEGKRG